MSAELRGIPPLKDRKFQRIILSKDKVFTMGRFAGASLPILDVKVSRKPAVFEYINDSWTITDKASMNGVFVNDSAIPSLKPISLRHGDIIKLGPIQDYRWIFFLENTPESSSPPCKKSKSVNDENSSVLDDMESQMLESMDRIDKERESLAEEVKESKVSTIQLLSRKSHLHQSYKEKSDELALKEESERQDILNRIEDVREREKRLSELEERLLHEKNEMGKKSEEALKAVDDQISAKMKLLEENKRTINALQIEKREAEECLDREKKIFEEKIAVLQDEYENKVKNEESYQLAYKRLSSEMESKLKAGCEKIETVIEKERKEKESLKIEFEEMKAQSSRAQQRLEDVIGTCEEEFKCTICDEIFIKPVTTNCGHVFCEYCISKWKEKCKEGEATCPNCRLLISSFSKNHYLENLINSLVRKFGDDIQNERDKLSEHREQEHSNEGGDKKEGAKLIHPLILAANRIANNRKKRKRR